jgi:hypothetical protein
MDLSLRGGHAAHVDFVGGFEQTASYNRIANAGLRIQSTPRYLTFIDYRGSPFTKINPFSI